MTKKNKHQTKYKIPETGKTLVIESDQPLPDDYAEPIPVEGEESVFFHDRKLLITCEEAPESTYEWQPDFCGLCDDTPQKKAACNHRAWYMKLREHLVYITNGGFINQMIPQYAHLIDAEEGQDRQNYIDHLDELHFTKSKPVKVGTLIANTLYGHIEDAIELVAHFPEVEYLTYPSKLHERLEVFRQFKERAMSRAVNEDDSRMENFIKPSRESTLSRQNSEIKVHVDATHKAFFQNEDATTDTIKSGYILTINGCVTNYNKQFCAERISAPFGRHREPKEVVYHLIGLAFGKSHQTIKDICTRNIPTRNIPTRSK